MTYEEVMADLPSHTEILTPNGIILIPIRKVPPEESRLLRVPKIEGTINYRALEKKRKWW